MTDITQSINYNYKTNVQTLTKYHESFNASLGRVERTTQRLTKRIGSHDRWMLRNEKTTYKNAKATNQLKGSFGKLGQGMGGLALRFVGYQMVLGQVMGMQQKMIEWVKKSITEFREFEKKMAEVSTIIGDLAEGQMPRLTAGVEMLSVRFGKSATDMSKGLYDILSAAFDSEDAIRLLTTATKASIAGLSDVATSVDIFTSVLNAYGMTASQAAHISDIFFQTIRRGKLVFEDLASAIGYVTPIAAAAGVEFEEIAAILATVTRMGLHVDMASRGLALTIQNIVSPTQQAAEAARKYNVDMSSLALRVKGLEGFMVELNTAVKEHGATILPEMIRNMRSLRVVMAVTSDEGIAGMTEDLGLMAKSAGQTEMAMTKMTAVTQMQVDILAQSMQYLERRIGEAWSGADIWWKKAKLWWGTLVSGGDANEAVKQFDDRIIELKASYLALLKTQTALAGKGTLMSEMLGLMLTPDMTSQLDRVVRTAPNMVETIKLAFEKTRPIRYEEFVDNLIPWEQISKYMETEGKKRIKSKEMIDLLIEEMDIDVMLEKYADIPSMLKGPEWQHAVDRIEPLSAAIEEGTEDLEKYALIQEQVQAAFDFFSAGLDDLSASMGKHQTNIIELQNAIRNLRYEVVTTYKAMSGETFIGKLDWTIAVKESEVFFDRFNKFAGMAIKYGDEFSAIDWFDEDIWDMIGGIEDYEGSMDDIINTLHEYGTVTKEIKKLQTELKDATDELAASIRKNNLEIMKIQLKGMMRRRGLSRTEQKTIKAIEIENAQFRIEQLEKTINFEDAVESKHIDALQGKYSEAKDILAEYTDRASFNLFLLKDIRDDDIRDLKELYTEKKELLNKYTSWEKDELKELGLEHDAYIALLAEISERPELDAMYKELYGFNAAQESIAELERLRKFQEDTGATVPGPAAETGLYTITKVQPLPGKRGTGEKQPAYFRSSSGGFKTGKLGDFALGQAVSWKRGTYNVPETQLAMVHRNEKIIPAGDSTKAGNGSLIIENLTIDIKEIAEIDDVEKLSALLSSAQNAQLLTRKGRTTYRLR